MRGLVLAAVVAAAFGSKTAEAVPVVEPRVIERYPHDPYAFTQGLLLHDGLLFESTGLLGRSSLRRVALASGEVQAKRALEGREFGEGLALVGDRLIQLTWRNGVAHEYALDTFEPIADYSYSGEGWGLCFDGQALWMSDGSDKLQRRDATTFELQGTVSVTLDGNPVNQLNELECVDGRVLANVWQTDHILLIEPTSGRVLVDVDASGLLTPAEVQSADVLNGIAHIEGERYLLTGKLWPRVFEVELPFETALSTPHTADALPGGASAGGASAGELAERVPPRRSSSCACRVAAPNVRGSGLCAAVLVIALGRRRKRSG